MTTKKGAMRKKRDQAREREKKKKRDEIFLLP